MLYRPEETARLFARSYAPQKKHAHLEIQRIFSSFSNHFSRSVVWEMTAGDQNKNRSAAAGWLVASNANFHTATFLCAPALEFLLSHAKKFDVQPLTFPRADDALGIEFSPSLRKRKVAATALYKHSHTRA
jgi:hypothetical protein